MFADLEKPLSQILDRQAAPYQAFWAMLAKFAAWHAPTQTLNSFVSQALRAAPEGQYYLAVWSAIEASFAHDLAEEDFDAALTSGIEYLRIQTIGSALRETGKESIIEGYLNLDSFELTAAQTARWAEVVPSQLFEPILMTLCSIDKSLEIDFAKWANTLYEIFGSNNLLLNNLQWIEIGLRATNGEEDAITKAMDTARQSHEQTPGTQRLAQLICCASTNLSPIDEPLSNSG